MKKNNFPPTGQDLDFAESEFKTKTRKGRKINKEKQEEEEQHEKMIGTQPTIEKLMETNVRGGI